jgi:hypothetical protein
MIGTTFLHCAIIAEQCAGAVRPIHLACDERTQGSSLAPPGRR